MSFIYNNRDESIREKQNLPNNLSQYANPTSHLRNNDQLDHSFPGILLPTLYLLLWNHWFSRTSLIIWTQICKLPADGMGSWTIKNPLAYQPLFSALRTHPKKQRYSNHSQCTQILIQASYLPHGVDAKTLQNENIHLEIRTTYQGFSLPVLDCFYFMLAHAIYKS